MHFMPVRYENPFRWYGRDERDGWLFSLTRRYVWPWFHSLIFIIRSLIAVRLRSPAFRVSITWNMDPTERGTFAILGNLWSGAVSAGREDHIAQNVHEA